MALTETHWKMICALSALTPAATLVAYATRGEDGPICADAVAANSELQPGFSMLGERQGPICTRVKLPPISN